MVRGHWTPAVESTAAGRPFRGIYTHTRTQRPHPITCTRIITTVHKVDIHTHIYTSHCHCPPSLSHCTLNIITQSILHKSSCAAESVLTSLWIFFRFVLALYSSLPTNYMSVNVMGGVIWLSDWGLLFYGKWNFKIAGAVDCGSCINWSKYIHPSVKRQSRLVCWCNFETDLLCYKYSQHCHCMIITYYAIRRHHS